MSKGVAQRRRQRATCRDGRRCRAVCITRIVVQWMWIRTAPRVRFVYCCCLQVPVSLQGLSRVQREFGGGEGDHAVMITVIQLGVHGIRLTAGGIRHDVQRVALARNESGVAALKRILWVFDPYNVTCQF